MLLTDILKSASNKHRSSNIINEANLSLSTFATNALKNTISTSSISEHKSLEDVKNHLISIEQNLKINEPRIDIQLVVPLENDEKLSDFIQILDCISAFSEVANLYISDSKNGNDWYSKQVYNQIKSINVFVDQLASCISFHANEIQPEINMNVDVFDSSKSLATIIKSFDEYKSFRKNIKKRLDFSNQPLNIRSLGIIITQKSKELLNVLK